MNRVLTSAAVALAFHGGLFWWGRDWEWRAAERSADRKAALTIQLAATATPSLLPAEGEEAVKAVQRIASDKSTAEEPTGTWKSRRRQTSNTAPPTAAPAPVAYEGAQAVAGSDPFPANGEPPPAATAPDLHPGAGNSSLTAPSGAAIPDESSPAPGGSATDRQETGGAGVVEIAARPLYRVNPPPPYPSVARQRNYEGTVLLEVLVDEKGRVGRLRIARSSGYPLLDQAALDGVKGWRFEPGRRSGEKIAMWVEIPIRFTLR
jgi:periplasmic protein TonB